MLEQVVSLGRAGLTFFENLGRSGIFFLRVLLVKPRIRKSIVYTIEQIHALGFLSLLIIVISALFIGMVLGLQGYNTLHKFGAEQQLGQLIALSIVRELGPVVTALLFAGRAGSSLTAEIGLMKSTDQLSSMEMMGVDPLRRVISPRLWASFISLPILTMIFCAVAILGGYLVSVEWLGVDGGSFWSNMQRAVDFRVDIIINGLLKSIAFAFAVTWIALFQGYNTVPTAAGVARATTNTVVYSSLAILGLDFILTSVIIALG